MNDLSNHYVSFSEIAKNPRDLSLYYMNQIKASSKEEEKWREKAKKTWQIYTGEQGGTFNILHSNTETIVPTIFNSIPVPDIRVRFNDRNEPARRGSQMLERGISYEMDEYDAQEIGEKAARDFTVTGRGILRVRYKPTFGQRPMMDPYGRPVLGQNGEQEQTEYLAWETVRCEFVPYDRFRRGPGVCWDDVPWVAFQQFLTKDELVQLFGKLQADMIPLNSTYNADVDKEQGKSSREKSVFRCAEVWEIWDKQRRKVVFVPAGTSGIITERDDPLRLAGFFPMPRPMQVLSKPGSMVPIVPYSVYEKQARELDRISSRILKLTEMAKVKGVRAAEIEELDSIDSLEEGRFLASSEAMALLNGSGNLDDAIWFFPIDMIMNVIKELVAQREIIKNTIFEQMGIADIMRGASQATETLGAQRLKAQWGSLRVQIWQNEVQRFWRDLMRLKAEIMAEHFQPRTLLAISGERPQTPEDMQMLQQVFQLLKSDLHRRYMIDIETDSTIQADRTRDQQAWNEFLTASAQFAEIFAPMVEQQLIPAELPIALYQAYSSRFKVGKQVEDLLAKFAEMAGPLAEQQQQSMQQNKQIEQRQRQLAETSQALDIQRKHYDVQKASQEVVGQGIENQRAAMGYPGAGGPGFVQ